MTARKAAAPTVKRSPAQVEAEGGENVFEWNGFKVDVPTDYDDWPTLAVQKFEQGRSMDGVELLFGHDKWIEFNTANPRRSDFNAMMKALNEHIGFVSGN